MDKIIQSIRRRLAAFFLLIPVLAIADVRYEAVDFILFIDCSRSMNDYDQMGAALSWAEESIIGKMLQRGDWIHISAFCGTVTQILETQIDSAAAIEEVKKKAAAIKADGYYTDLGAALDSLGEIYSRRKNNGRQKYMIILTDMIQQAPPDSPYLPIDKNFTHEYLRFSRIDRRRKWSEIVLHPDVGDSVERVTDALYAAMSGASR